MPENPAVGLAAADSLPRYGRDIASPRIARASKPSGHRAELPAAEAGEIPGRDCQALPWGLVCTTMGPPDPPNLSTKTPAAMGSLDEKSA
jgi:hypothetical protein